MSALYKEETAAISLTMEYPHLTTESWTQYIYGLQDTICAAT